jgi:hypothetical protein
MRILQLIVSGTLANAGRPERVKNKTKHGAAHQYIFMVLCILQFSSPKTKKFELKKKIRGFMNFCRAVFKPRLSKVCCTLLQSSLLIFVTLNGHMA